MTGSRKKSWVEFLNPDLLRPRLISVAIYIASFELLKDSIVSQIRFFYCQGSDKSGDLIDTKYQTDVLSRNKSPVYASLDWLKEAGAINATDIQIFERIKKCRNALTHDLIRFVAEEGLPGDFEDLFREMVAILAKIDVWWIKNVEMETAPELAGEELENTEVIPGRLMGLRLLCDIALGTDQQSRFYYDEFVKRVRSRS